MKKNFRIFLTKVIILVAVIFITRALFQFPIEYFGISLLKQTAANRLFSKIDALKILALVGLFFAIYYRGRIAKLNHPKVDVKRSTLYLVLAEITIGVYYIFRASTNYYGIVSGAVLYLAQVLIFAPMMVAFILFAIAIFDLAYLKKVYSEFRKELIYASIISVVLYNFLVFFEKQWPLFSGTVAAILNFIFSKFYEVSYYSEDGVPILQISDFSVAIGPPCSGIDSIFLFLSLLLGIFALDHKRIKKGRFLVLLVVGVIGVYAVNIVRLLLLILVGVHISPKFAVGLFHTQAGWLLFVIFFIGYYYIMKKFIYKAKLPGKE